MKAKFKIENPETVEMSLTITMPVSDWKRLNAQLATDYPAWKVGRAISDMVEAANVSVNRKDVEV